MIINRLQPSVIRIAGIFIFPGMNKFDGADEVKLRSDARFQEQVAIKNIEILEIKKENKTSGANLRPAATQAKTETVAQGSPQVAQDTPKAPDVSNDQEQAAAAPKVQDDAQEPKSDGNSDEMTSDISEMSAKDAVAIIAETLVISELKEMLIKEDRKSVIKAIKKQISILAGNSEVEVSEGKES